MNHQFILHLVMVFMKLSKLSFTSCIQMEQSSDEVDCIGIFESVFEEDLKGKCRVKKTDEDGKVILNENGKAEYEEVEKPVELTQSQKDEFLEHGHLIINYFTSLENRIKYFPNKKYEIVGIELPINMPVMNNLAFIGYLDIVLKDVTTGKIKIIDLKTSTRMWNKYQQNDMLKIMQLTLYKAFYSKQFGVPLSKIDVEFVILKRTLIEGASFQKVDYNVLLLHLVKWLSMIQLRCWLTSSKTVLLMKVRIIQKVNFVKIHTKERLVIQTANTVIFQ